MGYAGRDEIFRSLAKLIKVLAANAETADKALEQNGDSDLSVRLRSVRAHASGACVTLIDAALRLGGLPATPQRERPEEPAASLGGITQIEELERCRHRILRELTALSPRIRDETLQGELTQMRAAFEAPVAVDSGAPPEDRRK